MRTRLIKSDGADPSVLAEVTDKCGETVGIDPEQTIQMFPRGLIGNGEGSGYPSSRA